MTALLEFCHRHGTPKLKAAEDGRLLQYLEWAERKHFLVVAQKDEIITGMGIAWPCSLDAVPTPDLKGAALYIANLACIRPEAVVELLDEGARRWPGVRSFVGHRENLLLGYGLRHARLLYRLAALKWQRN